MSRVPDRAEIRDVGPRDGFQNEARRIPTPLKLQLIEGLADAGLRAIEVTSFVNPKVVPQFVDAEEVAAEFSQRADFDAWAFAGNAAGLERAVAQGMRNVTTALTVSEDLNQSNFRRSTAEMLAAIPDLLERAHRHDIRLEVTVGTAFGDTDGRIVSLDDALAVIREVIAMGVTVVMLGDTVGVGTPSRVAATFETLIADHPDIQFGAHFHDTRGMGVANALAAWQVGVRRFDASFGGLGGCPFAPGATGNVATEALVYLFEGMGVATGIDLARLLISITDVSEFLGKELPPGVARAMAAAHA